MDDTAGGTGQILAASTDRPAMDGVTSLGAKLFELRDYTPIPLILLLLVFAEPSARSATLGMLFVVLGELIRIYSVAFIGSVSRTRNTDSAGAALITTGPFAYVRNPLYVGNFCITFGIAWYGGIVWLVLLAAALFAFQYHCIVKYEESLLKSKFGQQYEDYLHTVPAWVPARWPGLESIEWPTSFSGALKSERRTLSAIAAMLLALMIFRG